MMFFTTVALLLASASAFFVQPSVKIGSMRAMTMNNAERTYIMIKPDGVQRNVVGNIIGRFEAKGYQLKVFQPHATTSLKDLDKIALKLVSPSKEMLEEHYQDLKEKKFFPAMLAYMLSGPVVAMVWEGKNAVVTGRKMLGATNPADSAPGTIRGDFAIETGRNICHGSDSVESAEREIGLWFSEGINEWTAHGAPWIYE